MGVLASVTQLRQCASDTIIWVLLSTCYLQRGAAGEAGGGEVSQEAHRTLLAWLVRPLDVMPRIRAHPSAPDRRGRGPAWPSRHPEGGPAAACAVTLSPSERLGCVTCPPPEQEPRLPTPPHKHTQPQMPRTASSIQPRSSWRPGALSPPSPFGWPPAPCPLKPWISAELRKEHALLFHIEASSAVLPAPDLLTPDSNPLLPSFLLPSWGPGLRG